MKEIKDFPNYSIDTDGTVINKKGHIMKPEITNTGYHRVSLSNNNIKHKRHSVHRLVAETYIPNPDNLPQVNHKDLNRTNNNVDNLEWCTPLYNLEHADVINKASIAKFQKVKCNDTGEVFNSIKEACERYNLHHSNIVACCNGRRHKVGGLSWSYYE